MRSKNCLALANDRGSPQSPVSPHRLYTDGAGVDWLCQRTIKVSHTGTGKPVPFRVTRSVLYLRPSRVFGPAVRWKRSGHGSPS